MSDRERQLKSKGKPVRESNAKPPTKRLWFHPFEDAGEIARKAIAASKK